MIKVILCSGALMLASIGHSQTPPKASTPPPPPAVLVATPKTPYDSTPAKLAQKTMENLKLKADADLRDYQDAIKVLEVEFEAQKKALQDWTDKVRKDNTWDENYTYDTSSDSWTHKATKEEPKVETKK